MITNKVIVTNDYKFNSLILNFLLLFFFTKRFYKYKKSTKPLTANKNKKCV